jgi:hypothetical protein
MPVRAEPGCATCYKSQEVACVRRWLVVGAVTVVAIAALGIRLKMVHDRSVAAELQARELEEFLVRESILQRLVGAAGSKSDGTVGDSPPWYGADPQPVLRQTGPTNARPFPSPGLHDPRR